jgi:FemAB-related protein (PEP-CTERM system-associated)
MIRLVPLDATHAPAWEAFVAGRPEATFFHRAAWPRLIAEVFGHRDRSMLALQDGSVVGVLPLTEMRTLLFGHSLMSLPFCVYGGPLAVDAASGEALLDHAAGVLASSKAAVLELRGLAPVADAWLTDPAQWPTRENLYATFRKPITVSDEANLKAIPRKQRAVVRKGIERGLTAAIGTDVTILHRIYAESVRNLGTPVFPRKWFAALTHAFAGDADVVTIADAGVPVASVLSFHWRDEVLPYYGGGIARARTCHANDFMYWEVMRNAAARGARLFDFGRSKHGTGAFAFTRNWGFEPRPLTYRFRLRPGAEIPDHNPLNPKYRLMIAAWKRLPLPVAGLLGPHLVRGVG